MFQEDVCCRRILTVLKIRIKQKFSDCVFTARLPRKGTRKSEYAWGTALIISDDSYDVWVGCRSI